MVKIREGIPITDHDRIVVKSVVEWPEVGPDDKIVLRPTWQHISVSREELAAIALDRQENERIESVLKAQGADTRDKTIAEMKKHYYEA
ncbi:hypothetical protein A2Z67_01630 [Candidatus Woesebacteria bacterium RBG_13_36_22]|uniref:Uncharacterized protein n=1 Tax=Candidatus Woesebacteria bacterium RBG_13_36_22 TaxID=1802478 RepID=A0A1F7X6V1_9BACT|nr:MAG: hypothetical protein A2Z67_01630 [Candidatus Woesebacteria bacterium RBG_13_36_22]